MGKSWGKRGGPTLSVLTLPLLVGVTGAPHRLFLAADTLHSEVLSMQLPLLPTPGLLLPLPGQLSGQRPGPAGHMGREGRQSHRAEVQSTYIIINNR